MIEKHPHTAIFFIAVFLSVGMAVMNLILGVVVSVAEQAKEEILQDEKGENALRKLHTQCQLLEMCRQMDKDGSGGVEVGELAVGLKLLGLDLTDGQTKAFHRECDMDGDGTVTLKEFMSAITSAKVSDVIE